MKDCASCNHHRAGPLSGWLYCMALHGDPRIAHQTRQERAPCGPDAAMHRPQIIHPSMIRKAA